MGEREAFVRETYAGLYRWFCRLTASAEGAADLTQETFAAFWASSKSRPEGVEPATWLYAIGRHLWRKRIRDREAASPEGLDGVGAGGPSPERRAQDREFGEAAERAVAALPPDLREAFTLRFWGEFAYEQIGEVQGIDPALARWRYFAARRRLHRALAAWAPGREDDEEDCRARGRNP